jgi:hypothetical protein
MRYKNSRKEQNVKWFWNWGVQVEVGLQSLHNGKSSTSGADSECMPTRAAGLLFVRLKVCETSIIEKL